MTVINNQVFGLDFDNTVAGYDAVFLQVAAERGLVSADVPQSKNGVRAHIRGLENGETEWRRLQALVYGPRMMEATPNKGALSFVKECNRRDIPVFIVSHKTMFANLDETNTNLREASLNWLERHGFFNAETSLTHANVFFENTRQEKLVRIEALGCTHFVDDLPETFLEKSFPAGVERILYAPNGNPGDVPGVSTLADWNAITARLSADPAFATEN